MCVAYGLNATHRPVVQKLRAIYIKKTTHRLILCVKQVKSQEDAFYRQT